MPHEIYDAYRLQVLGVPLAAGLAELEEVPARLIDETLLIAEARQEAADWEQVKAEAQTKMTVNRRGR